MGHFPWLCQPQPEGNPPVVRWITPLVAGKPRRKHHRNPTTSQTPQTEYQGISYIYIYHISYIYICINPPYEWILLGIHWEPPIPIYSPWISKSPPSSGRFQIALPRCCAKRAGDQKRRPNTVARCGISVVPGALDVSIWRCGWCFFGCDNLKSHFLAKKNKYIYNIYINDI